MLRVKFPNELTDKEIDTAGMLPLALTGREAMEHIEGKTMTDIVAMWAYYCDLLKRMMARVYVPNGNGTVQYLEDMKQDQFGAKSSRTKVISATTNSL